MDEGKISIVMTAYPEEAPGWQNGVYHERVRKEDVKLALDVKRDETGNTLICPEAVENSGLKDSVENAKDGLCIKTEMWTETEDTGFGIYPYVNGPAFCLETGLKDVRITLVVSNPTNEELMIARSAMSFVK